MRLFTNLDPRFQTMALQRAFELGTTVARRARGYRCIESGKESMSNVQSRSTTKTNGGHNKTGGTADETGGLLVR